VHRPFQLAGPGVGARGRWLGRPRRRGPGRDDDGEERTDDAVESAPSMPALESAP